MGDTGGPFDDSGDEDATFVDLAFDAAMRQAEGGVGGGAVVAAVEDEGVVAQALVGEVFSEGADGAVHGGDFGVTFAEHFAL